MHDPLGLAHAAEILRSAMLASTAAVGVLALTSLGGVIAVAVVFARYLSAERAARNRVEIARLEKHVADLRTLWEIMKP